MKNYLLALLSVLLITNSYAQVKTTEGPPLNNETDNKMNRMIEGEDGEFYAYRIRTKGKGTVFLIEKFDNSKLTTLFSKEVDIPTEKTKIIDVLYASGKVYMFYRTYDKDKEIMTLYYKTVSSEGVVTPTGTELVSRKTDHYEFIDFILASNQSKSKIALKTTFKANKEMEYKTDFVLLDAVKQKIEWTKTVPKYLKRNNPWFVWNYNKIKETTGFLGLMLDDNDDIYYSYNDKMRKDDKKDERYNFGVDILKSASTVPQTVKLDMNPEYLVYDVQFAKNKQGNIVVAGFFKDIMERKGRDLVDVGVFDYSINSTTGVIEGKAIKTFDAKMLTALESNQKKARGMNYKVDYLIPSGDDFYLVGEQYTVSVSDKPNSPFSTVTDIAAIASGANPWTVGKMFMYEYMDIIVAKINSKGEIDWISNSPLRNGVVMSDQPHVFKQYFAALNGSDLYLFYNEHPKNVERLAKPDYEPKDLKTQMYIHGSNMVYSKITPDGKVKHEVAYKNDTYCFAPIQERTLQYLPPEDAEIYATGGKNAIVVYTEDKGKGRFLRVEMQ